VESHTRARARSPGLAWPGRGGAGRRARAHDMRVNGPPKSGPSPCGGAVRGWISSGVADSAL
jgi:hypothetical protein